MTLWNTTKKRKPQSRYASVRRDAMGTDLGKTPASARAVTSDMPEHAARMALVAAPMTPGSDSAGFHPGPVERPSRDPRHSSYAPRGSDAAQSS